MRRKIIIEIKKIKVRAFLNNSNSATQLWSILPLEKEINVWENEIYFNLPTQVREENSKTEINLGDLVIWPPEQTLCIFFGPTALGNYKKIKPEGPVNIIGKMIDTPKKFKKIKKGKAKIYKQE